MAFRCVAMTCQVPEGGFPLNAVALIHNVFLSLKPSLLHKVLDDANLSCRLIAVLWRGGMSLLLVLGCAVEIARRVWGDGGADGMCTAQRDVA